MTKIFVYSNQPVIEYDGLYYSKLRNFVDFLSLLSSKSDNYTLIVPCKSGMACEVSGLTPINLPERMYKLPFYEGHIQAILHSIKNIWRVIRIIKNELVKGVRVVVAGPGPNSFLYMLSIFLPKEVRYAFFIRGNTSQTVRYIYSQHTLRFFIFFLVELFQRRIYSLLTDNRAIAFTYGSDLQNIYGSYGKTHNIAPLIDENLILDTPLYKLPSRRGTFKILFVGRLSKEKGILDLLDAFAIAKRLKKPYSLTVVGFGILEDDIKQKISSLGLDNYVDLVGFVPHGPELWSIFDRHDLLCLPSYTEGVPRVIVEAMARGLPVASTLVGGIPALFSKNVHPIEDNSPDCLFRAIDHCALNPFWLSMKVEDNLQLSRDFTIESTVHFVGDKLRTVNFY